MHRIPPDSVISRSPRRGLFRVVGVLVLVMTTGACATKRDVRDLRDELIQRSARQDSIMVRIVSLLGQLDDSVSNNSAGILEARADLMREVLDVQDQLLQLQEMAGQSMSEVQRMRAEIEQGRQQLSRPPAARPSGDADQVFQASMDAYARQMYSAAQRGFEGFAQAHPDDERVTDAEFYIAEILARAGTDEGIEAAVQRYVRIPSIWPDHPRAPQALYSVGLLEMERDNRTGAAVYFDRVVTGYPDTEWAQMARERLAEIR